MGHRYHDIAMILNQNDKALILAALLEGRQSYILDHEEHGADWKKFPGESLQPALKLFGIDWNTGRPLNENKTNA
jgi:hypothetical protein